MLKSVDTNKMSLMWQFTDLIITNEVKTSIDMKKSLFSCSDNSDDP